MAQLHHLINVKQIADRELIKDLFDATDEFYDNITQNILKGKILASIFYEPSTRTRLSFESAMLRMGGQVITSENAAQDSSAKKGESLEDAIQVIGGYADVIVLRHPEKGSAERAAQASSVPVINAGDGSGEHPTQALLDLYTIHKELGKIDGLHIAVIGDLQHSRTIHSFLELLKVYSDIKVSTEDFDSILPQVDVLYMNRVQKERLAKGDNEHSPYTLDASALKKLSKKAIIMHPLPRVDEIATSVDKDPRAAYFRQAENGLYVRMALLQYLLA